jgi:cytoskeleton protein RodZ
MKSLQAALRHMTSDSSPTASPGDFGARLRRAREQRGISLQDIATRTRISRTALDALERNDIARLPGGIFTRAFVRAYAAEVGLNPERAVHEFIEEFPHDSVTAGTPLSSQADDNEAIESERRVASAVLTLVLISLPLAGAVVYFGATGRQAAAPASATASADAAARPLPTGTQGHEVPVSGIASTRGDSVPPPAADRQPASAAPPLVITLRADAPCWTSASVDGQRQVWRTLQPGDEVRLSASREVRVSAGNAAALGITINGAPARPLGTAGEVVTKSITLQNYRTWLQ